MIESCNLAHLTFDSTRNLIRALEPCTGEGLKITRPGGTCNNPLIPSCYLGSQKSWKIGMGGCHYPVVRENFVDIADADDSKYGALG